MIWHENVSVVDLPRIQGELVTTEARQEFGRRFKELQDQVDASPELGDELEAELSQFRKVKFASSNTYEDAPDMRLVYRIARPECYLLCVGKRDFAADEPYRTARQRLRITRSPRRPRRTAAAGQSCRREKPPSRRQSRELLGMREQAFSVHGSLKCALITE